MTELVTLFDFDFSAKDMHRGVDTSVEAAEKVDTAFWARKTLIALLQGPGAPEDVVDRLASISAAIGTIRPRFTNLRAQGLIENIGEKRKAHGGRRAHICRITQAGRDYLNSAPASKRRAG